MNEQCRFSPTCDKADALKKITKALGLESGEAKSAQEIICTMDTDVARRTDCPAFSEREALEQGGKKEVIYPSPTTASALG